MIQQNLFGLSDRIREATEANRTLATLNTRIDWESFRPQLLKIRAKDRKSRAGRPPFDVVLMFKVLILQELYNLSDAQIEMQIRDRLSFMAFLGLTMSSKIPDEKTVWLFREELRQKNLTKSLFELFRKRLREQGIETKSGAMVDASIVEVPTSRNTREENETLREGKIPESFLQKPNKHRQKDTDAKWTKKHKRSYFGFKNHLRVDASTKLIETYAVTSASVHDSQVLLDLLDEDGEGRRVYADSAYRGAEIEDALSTRNYASHIHERAYRNRPLLPAQLTANTEKSRTRVRVEHVFGTQSQCMGSTLIRTIGLDRARVKLGLRNLLYNMRRFTFLRSRLRLEVA